MRFISIFLYRPGLTPKYFSSKNSVALWGGWLFDKPSVTTQLRLATQTGSVVSLIFAPRVLSCVGANIARQYRPGTSALQNISSLARRAPGLVWVVCSFVDSRSPIAFVGSASGLFVGK